MRCSSVPKCISVGPTVLTVRNGTGRVGQAGLVHEDQLLDHRAVLAAVLLRPADAEPAVLAHLAHEPLVELAAAVLAVAGRHLLLHLGRHQPLEVGAELAPKRVLLVRERDLHPVPLVRRRRRQREPVLPPQVGAPTGHARPISAAAPPSPRGCLRLLPAPPAGRPGPAAGSAVVVRLAVTAVEAGGGVLTHPLAGLDPDDDEAALRGPRGRVGRGVDAAAVVGG